MTKILGLDEVGRGALAGPVMVGAVLLDSVDEEALLTELLLVAKWPKLRDSKKATERQKERIASWLPTAKVQMVVGVAEAYEVDKFRITGAVKLAAGRAIEQLQATGAVIDHVEADASLFHPYEKELPTSRTIKGDENILAIALASIWAKVYRDTYMKQLFDPGFGYAEHVGYGTPRHLAAIKQLGLSDQHRRSFCHE